MPEGSEMMTDAKAQAKVALESKESEKEQS